MSPQGDEGQIPAPRLLFLQQFIFPLAKALKECFAVDGFHPAAFQVVIAAVKHFAGLCKFIEICQNNVLNSPALSRAAFLISPKMSNCSTLPAERSCPRRPARRRKPRLTC